MPAEAEEKEIGAAKRNEDTTGSRHCSIPSTVTNTQFVITDSVPEPSL